MVDYLEILRLKHLGYSQRQIIGSVGCSSHTIKDTWEAAQELNLQWPMPENTTNEELKTILFPNKSKPVQLFAEPDYAYIHGELAKSDVTLTLLWEEYRQKCYMECKTPYSTPDSQLSTTNGPAPSMLLCAFSTSLATQLRSIGLEIQSLIMTQLLVKLIWHTCLLQYCPAVSTYMLQFVAI